MAEVSVNESLELIRKNRLEFALRFFRSGRASGHTEAVTRHVRTTNC